MIDRLERLINLVIALRETRRPLGADEIRRRVAGYGQPEYESFRRMFERDKADLRALGVPVETLPSPSGDDVEGYRIPPDVYDLPAIEFPPEELAVLGVALQATGLLDEGISGLRKVEVAQGRAVRLGDPAVAVPLADPNRPVLSEAQLTRTRVRFTYRRADGAVSTRLVEPYGMVFRGGQWYVVGRDCGRGARRSFRLDRITDDVRPTGRAGAFEAPDGSLDADAVVPSSGEQRVTARVAVRRSLEWRVARRARGAGRVLPDGRRAYEVVGAPDDLLDWALEDGPEVEVLAPDELRQRVRDHLRDVLDVHGGRAPASGAQPPGPQQADDAGRRS